jgi:hypothetical protein
VILFLNVLTVSTVLALLLFVCIEVPWANTEQWFFAMVLPHGAKAKKN